MRRQIVGLAALLTMVAACRSGGDVGTQPGNPEVPSNAERLPVQPLPPLTLLLQFHSGMEERDRLVVRTDAEWRALWTRLTASIAPQPPLPAVDFTKHMIVVAAMGTRPSGGYVIRIREAAHDASALYVTVEETAPGANCGTITVMTAPATAVLVPRSTLPVRWVERTAVQDCE